MSGTAWPDEKIVRLRSLCDEGLSAKQIGAELGCTRNAIIGKASRLGLFLRGVAGGGRPPGGRPPKESSHRQRSRVARLVELRENAVDLPFLPPPVEHTHGNKTLLDLGTGDCRWPLGAQTDPATIFCGELAIKGRSYCGCHFSVAYQPRRAR